MKTYLLLVLAALVGILCPLYLAGCQINPVVLKQYRDSFKQCLVSAGIQDATPEGAKIWSILDNGGYSAAEIESKIEAVAISAGGVVIEDVASCAVEAWFSWHPVTGKPTPSQTAARLYGAKHLHAGAHR